MPLVFILLNIFFNSGHPKADHYTDQPEASNQGQHINTTHVDQSARVNLDHPECGGKFRPACGHSRSNNGLVQPRLYPFMCSFANSFEIILKKS